MAIKKQHEGQRQQEMVERAESSSPFWRNTRSTPSQRAADPSVVIGASYSHADILKLDTLSIAGPSRSTTPHNLRSTPTWTDATPKKISTTPSTIRRNYQRFLSDNSRSWDFVGDEDDAASDAMDLDDDEDEFGLPNITNTRKRDKKALRTDTGLGLGAPAAIALSNSDAKSSGRVDHFNGIDKVVSGDIAEERGLPNYPNGGKTEGKILKPQYKDILQDPANSLNLIQHSLPPKPASSKDVEAHSARTTRINKFKRILQASTISLPDLREAAWSGLPDEVRAMSWQILLGYLPTSSERRVATLDRKRKEYLDGVRQAFERNGISSTKDKEAVAAEKLTTSQSLRSRGVDQVIWHQISIDIPRTNPHLELYGYEVTQRSLERILYLWAIRHPASGYVQGINDLVTPFWQVFLGSYMTNSDVESGMDPGQLPRPVLDAVEADSFWCLSKLLDGIQDNYVHAQPGIHRQVSALRDLTRRIDSALVGHLDAEGVEFMQFSFRWMNCLLMREVSVRNTIRMWDTYLAEEQGFSGFHLYVCAAFLVKWSDKLLKMDFQEVMMFLQALPTREWTVKDVELLLSEAFIWQSLFRNSRAHLRDHSSGATTSQ